MIERSVFNFKTRGERRAIKEKNDEKEMNEESKLVDSSLSATLK